MSWFKSLFTGGATKSPVEAVTELIDEVWTSDEEELTAERLKLKLLQQPQMAQNKINMIQAQHRSVFVAGARPSIMWVCSGGLAFAYLINPVIQWTTGLPGPVLPMDSIDSLVTALLGLGAMRSLDKRLGTSK